MITTTRWTPDTCVPPYCVIDYRWNTTVAATSRVHTPSNIEQVCSAHTSIATSPSALYAVLVSENTRKNLVCAQMVSVLATVDPLTIPWSYSGTGASRVLNVTFPGATAANVTSLQNYCNSTFGSGTVVVTAGVAIP